MHEQWQKLQVSQPKLPPYLLWLEDYSNFGHEHWVRYFSPEEQAACQIQVKDGLLLNLRGRALSCPERQHFLFVIATDLKLYAQRAEPKICHASFTRGKPVLASGVFQAREGRLTHLKFESGHYISGPEHWWQAIQIFQEKELNFGEKLRITVFDRYRYISTNVAAASLQSYNRFLTAIGLA